jgi:hypothetical protein
MKEEEQKKENWLRQLCKDDAKLYDFLAHTLYLNPMAAISKEDLEILIEEAEKSIKDKNDEESIGKYRGVVDKAIFEATQHQEERDRYIKVIKDLALKATKATEKVKEKVEKEGLTGYATSLGGRIEGYKFLSEKIEDVIEVASHFYNDILETRGEKDRRDAKKEAIRDARQEEDRERDKEGEIDKKQEKERREKRQEEDREEAQEEKREKDRRDGIREKTLEGREEDKTT